jgi:hypothetical protein
MNDVKMTRAQIRAVLIGEKHKGKSSEIELFGVTIELRQPSLGDILKAREEEDVQRRTTDVFINYSYVPGTDERVFEDTDHAEILKWPFTKDLIKVQEAIADLTGVDLAEAEAEITEDPLED